MLSDLLKSRWLSVTIFSTLIVFFVGILSYSIVSFLTSINSYQSNESAYKRAVVINRDLQSMPWISVSEHGLDIDANSVGDLLDQLAKRYGVKKIISGTSLTLTAKNSSNVLQVIDELVKRYGEPYRLSIEFSGKQNAYVAVLVVSES